MCRAFKLLMFLAVGCCLIGCAAVYRVRVNGYTEPTVSGQIKPGGSFFIMENKEAQNPLLEQELKGKIARLLEVRGYPVTTTFDKADYYLFFSYGMAEPRSVGVPEYYGGIGWGYGWGGGWGCGWGGPSVCIGGPAYGYYGTEIVTIYDRWLQINVVEGEPFRTQKVSRPVWVGEARSSGASSDLRTVLNYLLVANFKEFGRNTGKAVLVELKAQDPEVSVLTR